MASSGSFSWSPSLDEIITDAYERCGIEGDQISAQMYSSAVFSFNSVMAETTSMQLNLWEVEPIIISLTSGVRDYALPDGTVDLLECYRRTYTAVTSPTSTGGGATRNYDFGTGNSKIITMIGYTHGSTAALTLKYYGSTDGTNYNLIASVRNQTYIIGQISWAVVTAPQSYRYYRIVDSAGATLASAGVSFGNGENDYVLGRLSRQDYDGIAVKTNSGIPVSYYVERTINPVLHIYQTPDSQYTVLRANRIRQLEVVSGASQTLDSPFRFLEAFIAMLAVKLAMKRAVDRVGMLAEAAKMSVKMAQDEDRERVEAKFVPDMSGYRI